MMDIILSAFSSLLQNIFSFTGDWGISIIVLTLIVRVILLPLTLKQKSNFEKQQVYSKKVEEVKNRFKNDKKRLDEEMSKLSAEGLKNMLGCLVTLFQAPVIYMLYRVFLYMPAGATSILVPWASTITMPDPLYIIPILSVVFQLMPGLLVFFGALKNTNIPKLKRGQFILICAFNFLFLFKAPLNLGIYWCTSNLFSSSEQVLYSLYKKRKSAIPANL